MLSIQRDRTYWSLGLSVQTSAKSVKFQTDFCWYVSILRSENFRLRRKQEFQVYYYWFPFEHCLRLSLPLVGRYCLHECCVPQVGIRILGRSCGGDAHFPYQFQCYSRLLNCVTFIFEATGVRTSGSPNQIGALLFIVAPFQITLRFLTTSTNPDLLLPLQPGHFSQSSQQEHPPSA
jgi:hypothetical protein